MDFVIAAIVAIVLMRFIDGPMPFVLPLLVVTARRAFLLRRRLVAIRLAEIAEGLGLAPDEGKAVSEHLRRGDRDAALRLIAAVQERKRAELRSSGLDVDTFTAEIGREIPWTDIIGHVFRVIEFDRAGTTVEAGNSVKAVSEFAPYGYLLVESPILNQPARLPIVHRDDFLLAANVFDDPESAELARNEELLVTYIPKDKLPGGLAGGWHALHYVVTRRGTLARYYSVNNDEHMGRPAPEKLFVSFAWIGQIRVGINWTPRL